jgi:hypothetical protein
MDSRAVSFGGMAGSAASEQDLALAQYALDLKARQEAADSASRQEFIGLLGETLPGQIVRELYGAVTLPGDVYAGKVDPRSDEAIKRSFDLAGALTLGAGVVPAGRNEMRMGIRGYHGSPHDFDQFATRYPETGKVKPAFFAIDEGTPRAKQYAQGYKPDDKSGKFYEVDIDGTKILDARKKDDLAKIRQSLDDNSAMGAHHFLEGNKGFQKTGLPDWGDDALFRALDKSGHKGVILNERPDVRSVAVFDDKLIKILRKYGVATAAALPAAALAELGMTKQEAERTF